MEKEHNLFLKILIRLNKEDVLRSVILIGGWCPLVYRQNFGNPLEISFQRTADLDFLVPNPPRINKDVDLPLIFDELGFDRKVSLLGGYEKYVHPDLEVEFLTPKEFAQKEETMSPENSNSQWHYNWG